MANVHDAMKMINVYGHCQCCCASACVTELAKYIGMKARVWQVNTHNIAEVFYDDSWHMLDCAYADFWLDEAGKIAGVDELNKGVMAGSRTIRTTTPTPPSTPPTGRTGPRCSPARLLRGGQPGPQRRLAGIMHAMDIEKPAYGRLRLFARLPGEHPPSPGRAPDAELVQQGPGDLHGIADEAIMQNGSGYMLVQRALGDIAPAASATACTNMMPAPTAT